MIKFVTNFHRPIAGFIAVHCRNLRIQIYSKRIHYVLEINEILVYQVFNSISKYTGPQIENMIYISLMCILITTHTMNKGPSICQTTGSEIHQYPYRWHCNHYALPSAV